MYNIHKKNHNYKQCSQNKNLEIKIKVKLNVKKTFFK